jgi:hypothetical protein
MYQGSCNEVERDVEMQVEVMAVDAMDRLDALELAVAPSRKEERRASAAFFVFIDAQAEETS